MQDSDSASTPTLPPCVYVLPASSDVGNLTNALTNSLREQGIEVKAFDNIDAWLSTANANGVATSNGSQDADGQKTVSQIKQDALLILGSVGDLGANGKLAQAAQLSPSTPLLIVGEASVPEAMAAIKQGATEVLLPNDTAAITSAAVQAAKAGQQGKQQRSYLAELRSRLHSLTDAENSVLDAMLIGMANKQIAQKLQIGLRTVELRRSKIMRKMGAKSLAELVKFICFADDRVTASILHEQQADESLEQPAS